MNIFILQVILLILALGASIYFIQLIKSFGYMNINELRRRTQTGDQRAERVLLARSHGLKLWLILWTILIFLVVGILFLLRNLIDNSLLSLLISVIILVCLLFALPWAKWPVPNLTLASHSSRVLNFILSKVGIIFILLKPFKLNQKINQEAPVYIHSKEDLAEIIKQLQSTMTDKQTQADLNLAITALTFSIKKINSLMTNLKQAKSVGLEQKLNPVVIDELNKANKDYFPVVHPKTKKIVGTLYFNDIKSISDDIPLVAQVMRSDLYYLHQNSSIKHVLYAFLQTHHHLFLVTNDSKEIVGLIDIFDVFKQYLGDEIKDELKFKSYDELEEVVKMVNEDKNKVKK